ncbi:IucA/IucC family protein [Alkalihalobacillus sp. 1P02AB]|uniref:IucA/IucC family protein n=1 Tax=Alkalihalobacillus sp. 1P02AB TaxID=3132260 RepID=UPI0039A5A81E
MLLPQKVMSKAEYRVRRQLMEAIIFENLLSYEYEMIGNPESKLLNFLVKGRFNSYQCQGKIGAFGRIRLEEMSIYASHTNSPPRPATVQELVEELAVTKEKKKELINELKQTVYFTEWNEKHLFKHIRRKFEYEELESAILEGHPYHPCFKSRTGFSITDHEIYGPEAANSFELVWLAVLRRQTKMKFPGNEDEFWREELGEESFKKLVIKLEEFGKSRADYTFFPVHPWQWEQKKEDLRTELEREEIVFLTYGDERYQATQSLRTLLNTTSRNRANLKFSMSVAHTSSLRTLATHSVCTAPYLSAWLTGIVESDPFLRKESKLVLLQEYTGMVLEHKQLQMDDGEQAELAVIWRENVRTYMKQGEEALPFTALIQIEADGKPFIDEWLSRYGIENWLERLIEVAIIPVWHLLIKHGVALEAHAQNMVLLHEEGWPTRLIVRDFHESVEYVKEYLANPERLPSFTVINECYQNSPIDQYFWMSNVEALRELVMDTLFVFNFSELSHLMESYYSYEENLFWHKVKVALTKHLILYPDLVKRHKQLQAESPFIYVESLLTKKVSNDDATEYGHRVKNTLTDF